MTYETIQGSESSRRLWRARLAEERSRASRFPASDLDEAVDDLGDPWLEIAPTGFRAHVFTVGPDAEVREIWELERVERVYG